MVWRGVGVDHGNSTPTPHPLFIGKETYDRMQRRERVGEEWDRDGREEEEKGKEKGNQRKEGKEQNRRRDKLNAISDAGSDILPLQDYGRSHDLIRNEEFTKESILYNWSFNIFPYFFFLSNNHYYTTTTPIMSPNVWLILLFFYPSYPQWTRVTSDTKVPRSDTKGIVYADACWSLTDMQSVSSSDVTVDTPPQEEQVIAVPWRF